MSSEGSSGGSTTSVNVRHSDAPSVHAASSASRSISCSTGCIVLRRGKGMRGIQRERQSGGKRGERKREGKSMHVKAINK